jgi:predicted AAA+ superfamily ATPase
MVGSFVFTDEEARYLKAVLRWQDTLDDEKQRAAADEEARRKKQPAGELRILVVGAKGSGKSSILTRVGHDVLLFHQCRPR